VYLIVDPASILMAPTVLLVMLTVLNVLQQEIPTVLFVVEQSRNYRLEVAWPLVELASIKIQLTRISVYPATRNACPAAMVPAVMPARPISLRASFKLGNVFLYAAPLVSSSKAYTSVLLVMQTAIAVLELWQQTAPLAVELSLFSMPPEIAATPQEPALPPSPLRIQEQIDVMTAPHHAPLVPVQSPPATLVSQA
jgi:hypothetical protein